MDRGDLAVHKKKARKKRGWIVFQDESGASQKPPLRRTWAPKGETPVVIHSYRWDKLKSATLKRYAEVQADDEKSIEGGQYSLRRKSMVEEQGRKESQQVRGGKSSAEK